MQTTPRALHFLQRQRFVALHPPAWGRLLHGDAARRVLGVSPNATLQDIKRAFLLAAMRTHPDRRVGGDSALFLQASAAYEALVASADPGADTRTTGVRQCPVCVQMRAAARAGNASLATSVWQGVVKRGEGAVTAELVPLLFKALAAERGFAGLDSAAGLVGEAALAGVFVDAEAHRTAYNDLLWELAGTEGSMDASLSAIAEMEAAGFQPDLDVMYSTFRYFGGVGA